MSDYEWGWICVVTESRHIECPYRKSYIRIEKFLSTLAEMIWLSYAPSKVYYRICDVHTCMMYIPAPHFSQYPDSVCDTLDIAFWINRILLFVSGLKI